MTTDNNRCAPSRRQVLKAALALGAAGPLLMARQALASKVSKTAVHYQNHPNGNQDCIGCDYFVKSHGDPRFGSCRLVAGNIAPNGWCELYRVEDDPHEKED
jgi:hypothetical protein